MSYIHEALKKAQKEKEVLKGTCTRILSERRFGNVLSKGQWLIPLCAIAAAFAFSSFSWFVSMEELASNNLNQSVVQKQLTQKREMAVKEQPVVQRSPVIAPSQSINKNPVTTDSPIVVKKTVVPYGKATAPISPEVPVPAPSGDRISTQKEQLASSTTTTQINSLSNDFESKAPEGNTPLIPLSAGVLQTDKPTTMPSKTSEQETGGPEKVEQSTPDQVASETLYNQALVLQKKGRLEEAKNLYEAALKQTPNLVTALNNLGAVYVQQNNLEEARMVLEKAIRISPQYADAYYNLACLHARRKDLARGMFYLKKSISIDRTVREWARTDEDLKNLREHSEYKEILGNGSQS